MVVAASPEPVLGVPVGGGEFVREVTLEDAVLDEDVFLGGVALVVDVDGAAAVGHAAVVDDGDLGGRDLLADEAGEGGGLLRLKSASRP